MKRNENLLATKEELKSVEGNHYYKASYMDEEGLHIVDEIGRFRTIEDLKQYVQQWCYDEIDDYEIAILITEYEVVEKDVRATKVQSTIEWFSCISDED